MSTDCVVPLGELVIYVNWIMKKTKKQKSHVPLQTFFCHVSPTLSAHNTWLVLLIIWVEVLFHSIGRPVRLGPDARDGRFTPQKWSEKASSDWPRTLSQTSDHLSPRDHGYSTSKSLQTKCGHIFSILLIAFIYSCFYIMLADKHLYIHT